ncbi:MAG TPA: hypothetical protein EYG52_00745 [Pseudomonadales bacterium]|nr:hypothetical protein [Gammaproteobacteria bacterium]HIL82025.1 hypothetical protein [Pseudomonadales bacterium]
MWTTIISPLGRSLRLIRLIVPRVFSLLFLVPCFARSHDLPLEALRLPPGFQISVFAELGPHVAPLAMKFYTGTLFPERYRGEIFIAEHGSWNRTPEAGHTGYNITMVNPETGATTILIDGWLKNNVAWGRPTDILEMPDGSLLIADDHANVIYRLTYETP